MAEAAAAAAAADLDAAVIYQFGGTEEKDLLVRSGVWFAYVPVLTKLWILLLEV